MATPAAFNSRMTLKSSAVSDSVSEDVGSSIISTSASIDNALAISTIWRCATGRPPTGASGEISTPSRSRQRLASLRNRFRSTNGPRPGSAAKRGGLTSGQNKAHLVERLHARKFLADILKAQNGLAVPRMMPSGPGIGAGPGRIPQHRTSQGGLERGSSDPLRMDFLLLQSDQAAPQTSSDYRPDENRSSQFIPCFSMIKAYE